jgi:4'-phosphopantetheinyl transferase
MQCRHRTSALCPNSPSEVPLAVFGHSSWQPPLLVPVASPREVHVWGLALDPPEETVAALAASLAAEERLRAERFRFERDRRRFVVARGLVRGILGRYLGLEPNRLQIEQASHGKPFLAPGHGDDLRFNLTHSDDRALLAVAHRREVGIDLEHVRPFADALSIAESCFSPNERAVLASLPPKDRDEAFFNCWARKEAFLKATGKGLSLPLDQLEVSLASGEPAGLPALAGDPRGVAGWTLVSFAPFPGFKAALVVEGSGWQPSFWWDFSQATGS